MSAMNELGQFGIKQDVLGLIEEMIAPAMWKWYRAHEEDQVVQVHVLFLRKTIKVKAIHGVFVLLFGPEPVGP